MRLKQFYLLRLKAQDVIWITVTPPWDLLEGSFGLWMDNFIEVFMDTLY